MQSCQFAIALDYWAISENSYEFPNYLYEVSLIVLHPLLQQGNSVLQFACFDAPGKCHTKNDW
jgi:hypothetical protein